MFSVKICNKDEHIKKTDFSSFSLLQKTLSFVLRWSSDIFNCPLCQENNTSGEIY